MSSILSAPLRAVSSILEHVHASLSPVDTDGANPTATSSESGGWLSNTVADLDKLVSGGNLVNASDIPAFVDAIRNLNGVGIDDREGLLEKLVVLMSRLPEDSELGAKMQKLFIDALYKDLPHPPQGFVSDFAITSQPTESGSPTTIAGAKGPSTIPTNPNIGAGPQVTFAADGPKPNTNGSANGNASNGYGAAAQGVKRPAYVFRTDDGSSYNPLIPDLGKAGTPYSRSVPSMVSTPATALPDPGLVFDTLLKRPDDQPFKEHPGGLSSLFFAVADIVIHNVFDTDHSNPSINMTSSYLDLAPLYGGGTKTVFEGGHCLRMPVHEMRQFDGRGLIWEDCFADARLLSMPPAVSAILVLLNRNHNFIAKKILAINEKGTFADPSTLSEDAKRAQDDELFHRARLVNCAYWGQVVLGDYVGGILGLIRDGSPWRLNLLQQMRDGDHELAPRGEGASVSVEFNMLYRWHATTSAPDAAWIGAAFQQMMPGKPYDEITPQDFAMAARKWLIPDRDLRKWAPAGMARGDDGLFPDEVLAQILHTATETPAHAFGARSTPDALRVIEIMALQHSRSWGTCTMNEFRSYFGLRPYANFKEWNPDPAIYKAAEALYHHIDNLELHTGLQAEETKESMPGAGLCPGFTIARAILADAVCLCRGDRFLTIDLTPANLTSWGFQDVMVNKEDGSYGGMLTKLFFRTLPDYFPRGSAYAHFPLMVPSKMQKYAAKNDPANVAKYTWTRPQPTKGMTVISTYKGVETIMEKRDLFVSASDQRLSLLVKGLKTDRDTVNKALCGAEQLQKWSNTFEEITLNLVQHKTITAISAKTKYLDVVKDVLNLVPVYFIANELFGLPLKTASNPRGIYRDHELYERFSTVANYVLINYDAYDDWTLRLKSADTAEESLEYITAHLDKIRNGMFSYSGFKDTISSFITSKNDHSEDFMTKWHALAGRNAPHPEMAASLFSEVVPSAADYSSALAHVVDFYLRPEHAEELNDIIAGCSGDKGRWTEARLVGYIREALRLNPPVSMIYRTAKADTDVDGTKVSAGQTVYANFAEANVDSTVFETNAHEPDFARTAHGLYSLGENGLMTPAFFEKTAPHILRTVFSLKNLKRGPGASGKLTSFTQSIEGTAQRLYIDMDGKLTPWPASLLVQYS